MPSPFAKQLNYNDLLPPIVLAVPHAAGATTLVLPIGAGTRLGTLAADRFFRVTALRNPGSEREVVLGVYKATGIDVGTNTLQNVTGDEGFGNVALPAGTTIEVRPTAKDYEEHSIAINANEAALAGKQRSLALVDVRDYGAVGDGVADDTAAVQAAVDVAVMTGRPLFLPPGQWTVAGLVAHGRIDVVGAGAGASVLRGVWQATAPLLTVAAAPKTIPAAASLSTLSRSADFCHSGLSADVRCLSLTHARGIKDALDGLADFTIEFVAKSSSASYSTWIQLADVGLDGGTTDRLLLSNVTGTSYNLRLRLRQTDGSYVTADFDTEPAAPSVVAPEHVAFCRSGTTVRTFVAGVLRRTYTGVTGALEVKPLDEFTLFGGSDLPFFRLRDTCRARVDSIWIGNAALYSATFTPLATVPWRGGTTLLWWNADQLQVSGTTPVLTNVASSNFSGTGATIQDPSSYAIQSCALPTFRDFTLREGSIGLYLSGAPGCRIDRVDSDYTRYPIWLQETCYHTSIRDCNFTGPELGIVAHNASGDLTIDHVHSAATLTAGVVLVNLQDQVLHRRCYIDGGYAAAYVVAACDLVVFESCAASEENRDPARPLTASWVFHDDTRCTLRNCSHGGGSRPVPAILAVATDAAHGQVHIEGSQFWMHASSVAVVSFAGVQPTAPTYIWRSGKSPALVPWTAPEQLGYIQASFNDAGTLLALPSAFAIGAGLHGTLGASAMAVGDGATAAGVAALSFGVGAMAPGQSAAAIGQGTAASGTQSFALGYGAAATNDYTVALSGTASGLVATALGRDSVAAHAYATAVGFAAATTAANQIMLGTAAETVVIPGQVSVFGGTPTGRRAAIADTSGATLAALEAEVNKLKALIRAFNLMVP